jgi:anti-sigma factor ChrR (cupin superfamily)
VLDGIFSDEHGDYPTGTYVRNPIGTSHTPNIGEDGATILVKLHQFHEDDEEQIFIDTPKREWLESVLPGLSMMPLHNFKDEHVALMQWAPNLQLHERQVTGDNEVQEIFVLKGTFHDEHGTYPTGSWLRLPPSTQYTPFTKTEGALVYIKAYKTPEA